jgi:hypothetical protein
MRSMMRSAISPLGSSRRQTGSEPAARTSSSRPAWMSLSAAFRAVRRGPPNGSIRLVVPVGALNPNSSAACAVTQHADEQEADCNHSAIMF